MRGQPAVVMYTQSFAGVPVVNAAVKVILTPELAPEALTGDASPYRPSTGFSGSERDALKRAAAERTGAREAAIHLDPSDGRIDGFSHFGVGLEGRKAVASAAVRPVYYLMPYGLEPAYQLVYRAADTARTAVEYIYAAGDGRLLRRGSLNRSATAYTYQVWADSSTGVPMVGPQGNSLFPNLAGGPVANDSPALVAQGVVTQASGPISTGDPWLPASATQTIGNNLQAYAASGGYGSSTATVGAYGAVSGTDITYLYDFGKSVDDPTNQQAAIANAFFTLDYMHDWYYDGGYDEKAGDTQQSNYGRGGVGGDPISVAIQNVAVPDNADSYTGLADGGSSQIRVGLFTSVTSASVDETVPSTLSFAAGGADFTAQNYSVSGDLVLVDDGSTGDGTGTTSDGCEAFVTAVTGKIAVVDRGYCTFSKKAQNAQDAGAAGLLVANSYPDSDAVNGGVFTLGGTASDQSGPITIPVLIVGQTDGDTLKTAIAGGPVTVTLSETGKVVDGALDNMLLEHEWTHTMVARLVGATNPEESGGLNEGWADTGALLVNIDAGADLDAAFTEGAYATSGDNNTSFDSYWYGFRRYPYSHDMSVNPLTYKYIEDGVALPASPTPAFDADGSSNSEVHNVGEIWASMLFDCYVGLQQSGRYTFAAAKLQMRDYLVAALAATPSNPKFTEARDALVAVAEAKDPRDANTFKVAFARRGLGVGALDPTDANTLANPTESFDAGTPVADSGPDQTVNGGDSVTLDGSYSSGDIVSYSWVEIDALGSVILTGASSDRATFTAPAATPVDQTLTFRLSVTDSKGRSSTDSVNIFIRGTLAPPVADAGKDQAVTGAAPVTLDGGGSTGDILSYSWKETDSSGAVTLSGVNSAVATFTAPAATASAQTLTFELTVTDSIGRSSTASVNVVVGAATFAPPVADAGADQTVSGGVRVTLDGSNSSGDIVSYNWTETDTFGSVSLSGADTDMATFTAPVAATSEQTLTFKLTVTDSLGQTSAASVNILIPAASGSVGLGSGGGGAAASASGGGGGAFALWMLLGLAGLALRRQR